MRRSSSASWLMGRLFCRIKALRSKTSRLMPSRVSPQAAPVRPGTGSLVPAYTALNSPWGWSAAGWRGSESAPPVPCRSPSGRTWPRLTREQSGFIRNKTSAVPLPAVDTI